MKVLAAVLLTLFAASVSNAGPQSSSKEKKKDSPLAALAKKTEKKSETKTYRATDLRKTKSRVSIPPSTGANQSAGDGEAAEGGGGDGEATAEGGAEGEAEPTPADERAQQQSQFQQQIDQQRELIQRLQSQNQEAQTQLNDQTLAYPGNPRRAQLMERIEKNNEQIATANQAIADLQTQARRAGVTVR